MFLLIVPPVAKPCEPLIGPYSLARMLRRRGVPCAIVDSNLEWFQERLWGRNLRELADSRITGLAGLSSRRVQRAVRHVDGTNPFQRPETYTNRDRYAQAVEHAQVALRLGLGEGADEEPGLADFRVHGLCAVSRSDLVAYRDRQRTIFDDYFEGCLLPRIDLLRPRAVGVSITFLHQVFGALRLAALLGRRRPATPLILGGALVDCWTGADWAAPPFDRFAAVVPASADAPGRLAAFLGTGGSWEPSGAFFADPEDYPQRAIFAPQAVFPLAFGRGCAWGRCTFCPDSGQPCYRPTEAEDWVVGLERLLCRFPQAVIHLTDCCVPPAHLDRLSQVLRERRWPVRWYAFVRLEESVLEPGRLERWASGGCGLLQFGLETAAQDLLHRMNKGIKVSAASRILKASAALGIRNYVYLLFGFPGETAAHQRRTLDFVVEHEQAIHYLNNAILNLPRNAPLARHPERFGIRAVQPWPGEEDDLSLYRDFCDAMGAPRMRARRFLEREFLAHPVVRAKVRAVPPHFKSNHALFARW
jgi:hypothetical protein